MGISGSRGRVKKATEEKAQMQKAMSAISTTPPPKMGGVDKDKVSVERREWDQPSR